MSGSLHIDERGELRAPNTKITILFLILYYIFGFSIFCIHGKVKMDELKMINCFFWCLKSYCNCETKLFWLWIKKRISVMRCVCQLQRPSFFKFIFSRRRKIEDNGLLPFLFFRNILGGHPHNDTDKNGTLSQNNHIGVQCLQR